MLYKKNFNVTKFSSIFVILFLFLSFLSLGVKKTEATNISQKNLASMPKNLNTKPKIQIANKAKGSVVSIEIVELLPRILVKENEISLAFKITNNSNKVFKNVTLNVYAKNNTPLSRVNLIKQMEAKDEKENEIVESKIFEKIKAGEIYETLNIPVEKFPFKNSREWGPRKITLKLISENIHDDSFDTTQDSTFIILNSVGNISKTKLSVIAPIVASDNEILSSNTNNNLPVENTKNRLSELMKLSGVSNLTLAIDPSLFDNSPMYFKNIATKFQKADDIKSLNLSNTQKNIIQSFKNENKGAEIIALPYANTNYLNINKINVKQAKQINLNESSNVLSKLFPNTTIHQNVLFADNNVLTADENYPKEITNIITSKENVKTKYELNYHPDAITQLDKKHSLSVIDEELSGLFANENISALNFKQLLLAQTAILTRQRPNLSRQFLIKLPDNFSLNHFHLEALHDLSTLPWVETIKYNDFIQKTTYTYIPILQNGFKNRNLEKISNDINKDQLALNKLNTIISDNNYLEENYNKLSLTAYKNWNSNHKRNEYVRHINQLVSDIVKKIKIVPSENINLIDSQANIPVNITNTLPFNIVGKVSLISSSSILQPQGIKTTKIPPFGAALVQLPVKAIANGYTNVHFTLTNDLNEIILNSPDVKINVKADWEDTASIIAIILGVLFIVGIYKNIHRNKKRMNEDTSHYVENLEKKKLAENASN